LQEFATAITWVSDDLEALSVADGVAIALLPDRQVAVVRDCLQRPNIRRLVLEKPMAPDPRTAGDLLAELESSKKDFRIGYTFRYTPWGEQLLTRAQLTGVESLSVQWSFMAHHFRHGLDNWKRQEESGGGPLRMMGIHVVALLAELGYEHVEWSQTCGQSKSDKEKWAARFTGSNVPPCDVVVDMRSTVESFRIIEVQAQRKTTSVSLRTPFDDARPVQRSTPGQDARVGVVGALCRSFRETVPVPYGWYKQTIQLWNEAEAKDVFSIR
jgi:predicted dehydrogenase